MTTLTATQIESLESDIYTLLENIILPGILDQLSGEFQQWVEDSRAHTKPYATTYDNRPRFDIEPGHNAKAPALGRIASLLEISEFYLTLMRNNLPLDAVVDLLRPNIRFENTKLIRSNRVRRRRSNIIKIFY
jgi:hypothetical protein